MRGKQRQQEDLREDHPERERPEQREGSGSPARITIESKSRWY